MKFRTLNSLAPRNEPQEGRNSSPLLRSCYIGSCHVGVSKRFSRSISLAVYRLSLPYHREHYANMGKNDTLFKDQEPQKLYPIPRQYLYSPYMGVLLRAPPSRLHAND